MNAAPALAMRGITKRFPGVLALDQVDFTAERGTVHCLVGANGAGKSTLVKVLCGLYHPDEGDMLLDGRPLRLVNPREGIHHGIRVIYQELSLVEDLTVAENIFLGSYPLLPGGIIDWAAMNREAQAMLDALGIRFPATARVADLSMGHKQITELCKALLGNVRIMIMDEPSAALSEDEFRSLVRVIADLKAKGVTVIYISHRLEELYVVGDAVTVLRDGRRVHTGPIAGLGLNELVSHMIGRELKPVPRSAEPLPPLDRDAPLRVENLVTTRLRDVSFQARSGEILGLYGLVGSGRTETLRALFGVDRAGGDIWLHGEKRAFASPRDAIRAGIGLVPEQRKTQGLILELPVWENAVMAAWDRVIHTLALLSYSRIAHLAESHVRALRVKTPDIHCPVGNLSGGNQQKIVIAKWLLKGSDILLFDEPTQGIDVGAKEEIYAIIREFTCRPMATQPGCKRLAVVASSELEELTALSHRILVFYEGGVVGEFHPPFIVDNILKAAITGQNS